MSPKIQKHLNPFFVTTNQSSFGIDLLSAKRNPPKYESPPVFRPQLANVDQNRSESAKKYDLSFLYGRESERIGAGIVHNSDSNISRTFALGESLSEAAKRKAGIQDSKSSCKSSVQDPAEYQNISLDAYKLVHKDDSKETSSPEEVEHLLKSYKHLPREQHLIYTTTTNDYGMKKPTPATYTNHRITWNQEFSKSFNSKMYIDEGLNTSLSRSKIHTQLDPHFI